MNVFQLFVVPLCALLFLASLAVLARGYRPRRGPLLSALIWLVAGLAVLWPDTATEFAQALGIGRGADLVAYLVAIAFLISFFLFYQKIFRLESEITSLTRHLALREADTGYEPDPGGGAPEGSGSETSR